MRGSFTPAIQLFGQAAAALTSGEPAVVCAQAELRAYQAWFTALVGQPEQGLRLALVSLNTMRQNGQSDISVTTLQCVNINAIFLNQYEIVIQTSAAMLARTERSGYIWERGRALVWQAYALAIQRQVEQARQAGQEALAIFEQLGNPFDLSVCIGLILGSIYLATGDVPTARGLFQRGLQAAQDVQYQRLLQICYDNLSTTALLDHDVDQAEQYFLSSLRISQKSGQTREMLASLRDFASVYAARGDLEGALGLAAVLLRHPASEQNSLNRPERLRDETEKLRAQIETQLDADRYRAAWETGQGWQLAEVVAGLTN